jgi:hypothetical protein
VLGALKVVGVAIPHGAAAVGGVSAIATLLTTKITTTMFSPTRPGKEFSAEATTLLNLFKQALGGMGLGLETASELSPAFIFSRLPQLLPGVEAVDADAE